MTSIVALLMVSLMATKCLAQGVTGNENCEFWRNAKPDSTEDKDWFCGENYSLVHFVYNCLEIIIFFKKSVNLSGIDKPTT